MKPKFKAGDYLVNKYSEDIQKIFVKSLVLDVLNKPCYIVDYFDGEPPDMRSVTVIERYYKLDKDD